MASNYKLEIITLITIAVFCIIFLYTNSSMKNPGFTGTDELASGKISGSAGPSSAEILPLIQQWVPPGAEIESTLFALQAALGGMFIGGVFGYWIGQKKADKI